MSSASQAPGDRLSALDAAFLYLERTGQLLHVGGLYPVAGALDFQRQLSDLAARLHLIPRYTQRAVSVPLGLAHPPRRVLAELGAAADAALELGRILLHPPPRTPFNGHVGTLRQVAWTTFSLNEAKAIKNRLGGTVNDVVLTTISAALRAYLEEHERSPERMELRAMCPVNVRAPHEHLKLGNRVSMMVAPLPVGIFDPRERYRQVRAAMAQLKASGQSARMARMVELVDLLPPPLQMVFSWVQMAAAPINTICTNIPGPPVSLYVQGKRLESLVPLIPLAQGVGLAFAILSYADNLTIGVTVDPALVPEADRFEPLLQAGFVELRELAGVEPVQGSTEPVPPERQRRLSRASLVA